MGKSLDLKFDYHPFRLLSKIYYLGLKKKILLSFIFKLELNAIP